MAANPRQRRSDALVAAMIASLHAPIPWVLPLVAHDGAELVTGVLGLLLLAGCACAPLTLVSPDQRLSRRIYDGLLLSLGGCAVSLELWWLSSTIAPYAQQGLWFWLVVLSWVWLPWALLVAGLSARHGPRLRTAPLLALLLVLVIPATARTLSSTRVYREATLSTLIAGWRHPDEQRIAQYLAWGIEGNVTRLWEAGSKDYRELDCLDVPAGCPVLPAVILGERQRSTVSCSPLLNRCTWVRTDRYAQPPLEDSAEVLLDWSIQTDIEGRFAGLDRLLVSDWNSSQRLPPLYDAPIWVVALLKTVATGVCLWSGLFLLLRLDDRVHSSDVSA